MFSQFYPGKIQTLSMRKQNPPGERVFRELHAAKQLKLIEDRQNAALKL